MPSLWTGMLRELLLLPGVHNYLDEVKGLRGSFIRRIVGSNKMR